MKKIIFIILILFAGWSYATNGTDMYNITQNWLVDGVNFVDYAAFAAEYDGSIVWPETPKYTLNILSAINGTVTKEPNEPNYLQNHSVILTATPDSNYIFSSWNGDLYGYDNPSTIIMDTNKDVNAVFISVLPYIDSNNITEPYTPVFEDCYIDLSIGTSNDDAGERLQYIITSLPDDGWLIATQPYAQYLTSQMMPYTIPEHSHTIVGRFSDTGHKTFKYKIFDGTYYSNEAIMDVNVSANSADSLTLTGSETVSVPDNNTMDISDGFGCAFYFRTLQANCGIFHKRGNAEGYDVVIENGRLRIYLYQSNGTSKGYGKTENYRVDTGRWYVGSFAYNNGKMCLWITSVEDNEGWEISNEYTGQPIADFNNNSDLIIGSCAGRPNLVGEFDRLRFYDGCVGEALDFKMMFAVSPLYEWRTMAGDTEGFLTSVTPLARFMFDEGTGTIISDDKHTPAIEAIVSNLQWLPNLGNGTAIINNNNRYNFDNSNRSSRTDNAYRPDNLISTRERY